MVAGITNARLATAKRGIAVEIATRLAATADTPVCLIGADPTDRDVERHLPQLTDAWGKPTQMQISRGPHHLEIATFSQSRGLRRLRVRQGECRAGVAHAPGAFPVLDRRRAVTHRIRCRYRERVARLARRTGDRDRARRRRARRDPAVRGAARRVAERASRRRASAARRGSRSK